MKIEEMESKIGQISQQISGLITRLNNDKKLASPDFNELLLRVEKDFKNCQRKLTAKKYFVACFGALKAGKSTLMNALVERKVSPTGAGETTLRCSIILGADEKHPEGITLYRSNSNAEDEKANEQRVNNLFAFFQDSIDREEIEKEFESKFYSFSNLEYILTGRDLSKLQDFKDFQIAEIRIKVGDDSILKKDVALIDMPGIDGAIAGGKENYLLKYVTKNCQHLLWVQSSMSAVNELTLEHVTEFSQDKPSAPIFSVYNIVKAKGEWLEQEAENRELAETCERIAFKFKGSGSSFYINAAMAWDAYKYEENEKDFKPSINKKYLLEKSAISALKERLTERVKQTKLTTIVNDALDLINTVERELKGDEHPINKYLKQQEVYITNAENAIKQLKERLCENLAIIANDIPGESPLDQGRRSGICAEMMKLYWEDSADMGALKSLRRIETHIPLVEDGNVNEDKQKEVIDKVVESSNAAVKNCLRCFKNNLFEFASKKLSDKAEILKAKTGQTSGQFFSLDFRQNVENKAENIILPDMMQWIEKEQVEVYKVDGFKWLRWVGNRNKGELAKHAGKLLDAYTDYLELRISVYLNDFAVAMDEVYKDFCRKYQKSLEQRVDSERKNSEKELIQAQETKSAIENIKKDWTAIRNNAEKLKQDINN